VNFYKRFIGDIQRDTGHLSCSEMGVYDRLLDHYYATESALPADVDACCRIARAMTKDERKAVDSVLRQYFTLDAAGFVQGRAEIEIADAQPTIAAARANGAKGGRPRGSGNKTQEKPIGFPNRNPAQTQGKSSPQPEPEPDKPSVKVTSTELSNVPDSVCADFNPGLACKAMREMGIPDGNPSHPTLVALCNAGATLGEFQHAAKAALEKGKASFNYAIGIVKRQREEAATLSLHHGQMPNKQEAIENSNRAATAGWMPPELREATA
jgi:uncharacterized protein YdaU (DUF1376 family)